MANKKFRAEITIDWELFRQRLRDLLDARGITPTDFARTTDLSPGTVCRWLYERTPDIAAAKIIADYFDVSIDWLIGRESERYSDMPENLKAIINAYQKASPQDRAVVDMLLSKYE